LVLLVDGAEIHDGAGLRRLLRREGDARPHPHLAGETVRIAAGPERPRAQSGRSRGPRAVVVPGRPGAPVAAAGCGPPRFPFRAPAAGRLRRVPAVQIEDVEILRLEPELS